MSSQTTDPNAPDITPLTEPRDGTPEVTTSPQDLNRYVEDLAHGAGPVAVDAERASGFRYGQDAYLVQIRRDGAGTGLIDPRALPDLTPVTEAIRHDEWVLHAADQDLPCLAEVGMVPTRIFDTELAGRLLNKPRVGLGALVASELGLALAKEHSAADWSKRPLPESWLRYAALDVEVLVDLRNTLAEQLADTGKLRWAEQEFAGVLTAPPAPPRVDPWRRTSGSHTLRERRQLAIVRSLWQARDAAARSADIAPGRILPDAAIIAAAHAGSSDLKSLKEFHRPAGRRRMRVWVAAVAQALELPESELPTRRPAKNNTLPQQRMWKEKAPEAAARLEAVKRIVRTRAVDLDVPQENLLTPEYQRRLAWEPPAPASEESVAGALTALGARPWQVEQLADPLVDALTAPERVIDQVPDPSRSQTSR